MTLKPVRQYKNEEQPLFPILSDAAVSEYTQWMSEQLSEDFSTTSGLPPKTITEEDIALPGLIIISNFSTTGYEFRTKERHEEYSAKVSKNQELAMQGKFDEVVYFEWTDPEYTLLELEATLIRLKNEVYDSMAKKTYYIQIFVEINTPKDKILSFLAMLEGLQVAYMEVYQ